MFTSKGMNILKYNNRKVTSKCVINILKHVFCQNTSKCVKLKWLGPKAASISVDSLNLHAVAEKREQVLSSSFYL